jgi:uncharacterized damage-inducible protein DinB
MRDAILKIMSRELDTLAKEISLYPDDASLWAELGGCTNSGGNLALHLVGNLRHFLGAQLGHTGFVRDRESEFTTQGLSRETLLARVSTAKAEVQAALSPLDEAAFAAPYPAPINGVTMPLATALIHLQSHLAFHLGQIDYHRRGVTGDRTSAGALTLQPLAD